MTPGVEWHRRVDFAEAAETLGVPTDQIAAMRIDNDGPIVVWTKKLVPGEPKTVDDVEPFVSLLGLDDDRVLVEVVRRELPRDEFGALLEALVAAGGNPFA